MRPHDVTPVDVTLSFGFSFDPADGYLEWCREIGEEPTRLGFRHYIFEYMLDDPHELAPSTLDGYKVDCGDVGAGNPQADAAGLPAMSGVVDVLNGRGFCDEPINPNADTITEWYEVFIAPAIDRIEADIRANPDLYGILGEELH